VSFLKIKACENKKCFQKTEYAAKAIILK